MAQNAPPETKPRRLRGWRAGATTKEGAEGDKPADAPGPDSYDILDEIAGRALGSGARVLAVRADDLPGPAPLAAFLRRRA